MRHHRTNISIPTILLICLLGLAATPWLGVAQEALWGDALIQKIDSLAEATITEGPVAGLSIGVIRGDDLLLARGYGGADIENGVPVRAETVFRIGSITKQFTAAAVMQLVEAGRIGLDDPITEYLPNYPTQGHEVTIRHLLTHTSGIKSYTGLESWVPKMTLDLSDEELVALFKDEPFDFPPGEKFLYNNSGFYLLGMIIEKASGETYRGYLNTHLFGPLGLNGSSYCDERPIIQGRAEGYEQVDGELVNDAYLSMNQPGAAGALCSTVPDLISWTQGHSMVSHGGGINGFNAMLSHYPDADLDVVVLSNTVGPHAGRVAETIARWALGIEEVVVRDEPLFTDELAVFSPHF